MINFIRICYSLLLTRQSCIVCKKEGNDGLCSECINELFYIPLQHKIKMPSAYCSSCSKPLISEKEMCISCKRELEEQNCNTEEKMARRKQMHNVFLFPYVGEYVDIVLQWKNDDVRFFSSLFASLIAQYIQETPTLQNIPIVPVPPRPHKLKTKGWDQIEDICSILEARYNIKILRVLSRKDGHTQKGLSKTERENNLREYLEKII